MAIASGIHKILHFAHHVDGSISNFVGGNVSSTASSLMAAGGFIGGAAYGVLMSLKAGNKEDNIVNKLYKNAVNIVFGGVIVGAIAGGASMLIKLACKIATYAWAHLPPIGNASYNSRIIIVVAVLCVCITIAAARILVKRASTSRKNRLLV